MSFSINGPEPTPAIQRAFHSNDGGAGNTGYFQQEKKKKNNKDDDKDILELSSKNDDEDKTPDSIGTKIKTFWFNLHGVFSEVIDNNNDLDNNPFN